MRAALLGSGLPLLYLITYSLTPFQYIHYSILRLPNHTAPLEITMSRSISTQTHRPKGLTGRLVSTPGLGACVEIEKRGGMKMYRYVQIKRNGRIEDMTQSELSAFINQPSWPTYYIDDESDNFIIIESKPASGSPDRGRSKGRSSPDRHVETPKRSATWNLAVQTSLTRPLAPGFNPLARRGTQ